MAFQISSALLDACVLSVLSRSDAYGYELTQKIMTVVSISESTLYPVLRRLQKDTLVTTYDMPFNGRNRRYYSITAKGREKLYEYRKDWEQYKQNIDNILGCFIYD